MRKKTIVWLYVIGIIAIAVGEGVAFAAASSSSTALALVGSVLAFAGIILSLISWIGALVATGKQGRWGWFVCVFLLSGLGVLIYLIAGPGLPAKDTAPVAA